MSEQFNVNEYWLKRGQTYVQEQRLALPYHRLQERFLFDVLRGARLPMRRVLELGCGFGRITKLLAENFPDAQITALDLSPDQLDHARRQCAGAGQIQFRQYDFYSGLPFPDSNYDVAIAIEVFLHHPHLVVLGLIDKLSSTARAIVNLDWSESWPWKVPGHVWIHDYTTLYAQAGLTCAEFVLPEKVEGKQQKLFIAARELPREVVELERIVRAEAPAASSGATSAGAAPQPIGEDWLQQLQLAEREIREVIPAHSTFILVNDDQWREDGALSGRRALPFLERAGEYWGPPDDDATAFRELERMRQAGAAFIVFAWPSFWWFNHYQSFHHYLRGSFRCLLENERLVIFKLKN
jgi:SAM-dependent methyltransferase